MAKNPLLDRAADYIATSRRVVGLQPDSLADASRPMSVIEDMTPAALRDNYRNTSGGLVTGDSMDLGPGRDADGG